MRSVLSPKTDYNLLEETFRQHGTKQRSSSCYPVLPTLSKMTNSMITVALMTRVMTTMCAIAPCNMVGLSFLQ